MAAAEEGGGSAAGAEQRLSRGEALVRWRIEKGKLNMLRRLLQDEREIMLQANERFDECVASNYKLALYRKPDSKRRKAAKKRERKRAAGGVGEVEEA